MLFLVGDVIHLARPRMPLLEIQSLQPFWFLLRVTRQETVGGGEAHETLRPQKVNIYYTNFLAAN